MLLRPLASLLLACTPALLLPAPTASACGMFYSSTKVLARERLVVLCVA